MQALITVTVHLTIMMVWRRHVGRQDVGGGGVIISLHLWALETHTNDDLLPQVAQTSCYCEYMRRGEADPCTGGGGLSGRSHTEHVHEPNGEWGETLSDAQWGKLNMCNIILKNALKIQQLQSKSV